MDISSSLTPTVGNNSTAPKKHRHLMKRLGMVPSIRVIPCSAMPVLLPRGRGGLLGIETQTLCGGYCAGDGAELGDLHDMTPHKLRAADLVARRLYEAGCRFAFGMPGGEVLTLRSEGHTSELQSLMRISYAGF